MNKTKITISDDGSNSLYSNQFNSHYHSTYGAINESNHIFIKEGLNHCQLDSVSIFEVGFGTGLNTFLAYLESIKRNIKIHYSTIEQFPIDKKTYSILNYAKILSNKDQTIFNKLHECEWNKKITISDNFMLKKYLSDFNQHQFSEKFDVIFFDAFAPEIQPELWSFENFDKLFRALNPNGILTTYSSKGTVKQNLRKAGFKVIRLKGPEGKHHILRAEKYDNPLQI